MARRVFDHDSDTPSLAPVDDTLLTPDWGAPTVDGRRSDLHDLYDAATVTFEADDVYQQADAGGFIRLNALRLRRLAEARMGEGE